MLMLVTPACPESDKLSDSQHICFQQMAGMTARESLKACQSEHRKFFSRTGI